MKNNLLKILLTLTLLSLTSCATPQHSQATPSPKSNILTNYNTTQSIYELKTLNSQTPPCLTLNKLNQTFTFSYDVLSSYLPSGNYQIKSNKLIAKTDDGRYQYTFIIQSKDTLMFDQNRSTRLTYIDSKMSPNVSDKAQFKLQTCPIPLITPSLNLP